VRSGCSRAGRNLPCGAEICGVPRTTGGRAEKFAASPPVPLAVERPTHSSPAHQQVSLGPVLFLLRSIHISRVFGVPWPLTERSPVILLELKRYLPKSRSVLHSSRSRKHAAYLLLESPVISCTALGHGVVLPSDLSVKVVARGFCPSESSLLG